MMGCEQVRSTCDVDPLCGRLAVQQLAFPCHSHVACAGSSYRKAKAVLHTCGSCLAILLCVTLDQPA